jgi:hypothetical protein
MHTKFPRPRFEAPDAYARQQANEAFMDVQDPAARNWRTAHFGAVDASGAHGGRMPNESPWAGYFDVLADRGAPLNPRANPAEAGLPAGYTEGQLDIENANALGGGMTPRWTQSQNLPSSQQRIAGSLAGLRRNIGGR